MTKTKKVTLAHTKTTDMTLPVTLDTIPRMLGHREVDYKCTAYVFGKPIVTEFGPTANEAETSTWRAVNALAYPEAG